MWAVLAEMHIPGSSRSGLLSINGPCPGFGAATKVRLEAHWTPLTLTVLGSVFVRSNLASMLLALLWLNVGFKKCSEVKKAFAWGRMFALFALFARSPTSPDTGQRCHRTIHQETIMEQTTARLRKTFHYPIDDDDDSLPEALDEEGISPK
jgi:hypothetical protein